MTRPRMRTVLFFAIALTGGGLPLLQGQPTHHVTTGYTRLQNELGAANLADASAFSVSQVEAPETKDGVNFAPNAANSQFTGKTFTLSPTDGTVSVHATGVGQQFYGLTSSFTPGPTDIRTYSTNGWLSYLGNGPYDGTAASNHSWIGSYKTDENTQEEADATADTLYRLLDLRIQQQNTFVAAGMFNGSTNDMPQLLGQGYNLISVGRTDGNHTAGFTTVAGTGRIKPDIVAPGINTSNATPMVASAGLFLRATAADDSNLAAATDVRALKALLLATASKYKFPDWAQTSTRPLDLRFGAGELNLYNAHRVLTAGPQADSTNTTRPARGWHAGATTNSPSGRRYFFEIPAGNTAPRFSAALSWHRSINTSTLAATLPNLTLRLYQATNYTLGDLVAESASLVDNLEHLYQPALPPGRYALVVTRTGSTAYALARFTAPTVTLAADSPEHLLRDGTTAITYTFTRNGGDTSLPVQLSLQTTGTAVAGTHYTPAIPATLTLPSGQSSIDLVITPQPAADPTAPAATLTLTLADTDFAYAPDPAASVTTTTLHAAPYSLWQHTRFTSAQLADSLVSGDTADPDADGLNNLLEYALDTEPLTTTPPPLITALDGDRLAITYLEAAGRTDLTYSVETTTDLNQSWSTGPEHLEETARVPVANGEQVTVRRITPAERQFLRLRVTR